MPLNFNFIRRYSIFQLFHFFFQSGQFRTLNYRTRLKAALVKFEQRLHHTLTNRFIPLSLRTGRQETRENTLIKLRLKETVSLMIVTASQQTGAANIACY